MTTREKQIADMEAELRLPCTKARVRDLLAMLRHARVLQGLGR